MIDKTVTELMPPQVVNVVGTGDGGITRSTTATTPPDQPNLVITYIPKFKALAARAVHMFAMTFGALALAGMGTDIIPYQDFLDLLWKCVQLSAIATFGDFLKGVPTITSQWAKDNPLLSGEV